MRPGPEVRPTRPRSDAGRSPSLLQFVGGHVVIEGVEFELDAPASGEPASAIRCEDTELILRGCSFRRPDRAGRSDRDVAAVLRPGRAPGPRGADEAAGRLRRSPAISTAARPPCGPRGPPTSRCGTARSGPPSPRSGSTKPRSERPAAGELRLIHTSILAGPGPSSGSTAARCAARVDDCVIAAAGREPAALVQVEDPRNLGWRGRSNLYGSIGPYLNDAGQLVPADISPGLRGVGADLRGTARGGVAGVRVARLGCGRPAPGADPGAREPDSGLPAGSHGSRRRRTSGPARGRSDRS